MEANGPGRGPRRRDFLRGSLSVATWSAAVAGFSAEVGADGGTPASGPLIESIEKVTLRRNRDGGGTTWFHPRACVVPAAEGGGGGGRSVLMTMQSITGSDTFGPVHWTATADRGETWSDPRPIPAFGRRPVSGHEGLEQGVCDVVPGYHARSRSVLGLGHVVYYRGPRFSSRDQLARFPVYAVRHPDGSWSALRRLEWDDPRGSFIYTNNCGQRVVDETGEVVMAFTFGSRPEARSVAGVRCAFDGEELVVREVGPAMTSDAGRGFLEPSVTRFGGRFLMTIRAEDGRGYVSGSGDGLCYDEPVPWCWDDGERLEMSTTQQHWLTHSDGLHLVYTRKDPSNLNVIRWRAPLFTARVDPATLRLVRATERVVLPLVGDGIDDPDGVALMGNFHVVHVDEAESWVTVGEWLPRQQARGDLLMARIRWRLPNRTATG